MDLVDSAGNAGQADDAGVTCAIMVTGGGAPPLLSWRRPPQCDCQCQVYYYSAIPTYCFVTYRLSGALDRLCKLDMEERCKWIVHGTDGLSGKGCTRMRPNLKLHLPVLGHAFESLVSWHSSSLQLQVGKLCCVTSIYSSVVRFKPVDTSEVAQAQAAS